MIRILHQFWAQGEDRLPPEFRANRELWRDQLPPDWELRLWTDENAAEMWPEWKLVSPWCSHHAMRCDLVLARAQRDLGGMACGTDVVPLGKDRIENLLEWCRINGTMVIHAPHRGDSPNGLSYVGSIKHPFWVDLCERQMSGGLNSLGRTSVLKITGPGAWSDVLRKKDYGLSLATPHRAFGGRWGSARGWVDPVCANSWSSRRMLWVEPVKKRFAMAIPRKCASTSLLTWMYRLAYPDGLARRDIHGWFKENRWVAPASEAHKFKVVVAVHRDPANRLASFWGRLREKGLMSDSFLWWLENLDSLRLTSPGVALHTESLYSALGHPASYDMVVPLSRIDELPGRIGAAIGEDLGGGSIPILNASAPDIEIPEDAMEKARDITSGDRDLGWDGLLVKWPA